MSIELTLYLCLKNYALNLINYAVIIDKKGTL